MDIIELWNGSTKALVDPIGAWLTNVSDEYGDVLHPKRNLVNEVGEKKVRGGMHVCLPNFGPGGDSGQPQHGFGREMTWTINSVEESKAILTLPAGKDEYEQLRSVITYQLKGESVTATLELTNDGDVPLRVAPGFHPYFALDRNEQQVTVNGEVYETADVAGTVFFEGISEMDLLLRRRTITVQSKHLTTWALWTDELGDYVCCEPTVGGYTFLDDQKDIEVLLPQETKSYTVQITW